MKKLFSVLVALTFVLSLAAVAVAADKPASAAPAAEPAKAAVPAKPEPAKKMEAKKEKSHQITGIVEAVDDAAGTLTVKGKKVTLAKIKVGDKVLVNYSGDTASSVKKVAEKKATPRKTAKKSQPKMAEPAKKEMAPAETAPPAGK
jgi:hypothetical protein